MRLVHTPHLGDSIFVTILQASLKHIFCCFISDDLLSQAVAAHFTQAKDNHRGDLRDELGTNKFFKVGFI